LRIKEQKGDGKNNELKVTDGLKFDPLDKAALLVRAAVALNVSQKANK